MASENRFAGAGLSEAPGDNAWGLPGNITADDNVDSDVELDEEVTTSERLRSTTYGFTTSGTIDGIEAQVEIFSAITVADLEIRLAKAGVPVGDDKSLPGNWPSVRTLRSYGGAADLWGTTWTPAEINATGFGLAQRISRSAGEGLSNVDYHRIIVTFTPPAVTTKILLIDLILIQRGIIGLRPGQEQEVRYAIH